MPQLPTTTVVTPWDSLGRISGVRMTLVSSWVWTSMKPAPDASVSLDDGRGVVRIEPSHGGDAFAVHGDVGREGGATGAVEHRGAANQQVEMHGQSRVAGGCRRRDGRPG